MAQRQAFKACCIKVISWNVHGLQTRTNKQQPKTDVGDSLKQRSDVDNNSSEKGDVGADSVELSDFDAFMEREKYIDIMCLVETFANSDEQYNTAFPGYTVIAKSAEKLAGSKQKRNPGGLLFAYNQELPYTFSKIPNRSDFILWVRADPQKPDVNVQMIFAVVYYPPSDDTTKDEIITIMKREYETLADTYKGAIFYIMGDFNANTHDKADYPYTDITSFEERKFTSDWSNYDRHAKYLLDFCKNTGFRIANGRFGDQSTGVTTKKHVLDYMLCRVKDWGYVKSFKVKDEFHGSDHKPIIFTIDTELPKKPYCIVMMEKLKSEPESNDKEHVIFGIEGDEEKCNSPELQLPGYNLMKQRENSNVQVYTKGGSPYNVKDLGEEFQQKSGMILNAFSLAPMSAPLLVTDIFCFFLKTSFSEENTTETVQTLNDCCQLYPKSRLTFYGYLLDATSGRINILNMLKAK